MHGAAQTLAEAVHSPINLRHHGLWVAAERQWISMAAIGGKRSIAIAEVAQGADDGCFRAVREVGMPTDHAGMLGEGALHAFFEFADAKHLSVDPDLPFSIEWLHAHLTPLLCGDHPADCNTGRSDSVSL